METGALPIELLACKLDSEKLPVQVINKLMAGIEPAASSLPRRCSTTELHQQAANKSGRRDSNPPPLAWKANALPNELLPQVSESKMVGRDGFEPPKPEVSDLQSDAFSHFAISPQERADERT